MSKKKKAKGEKNIFGKIADYGRVVAGFLKNPGFHFVLGLLGAAFVVFLFVSFVSFFSSGGNDRSLVEAMASGSTVAGEVAENSSGKGGAILADYLVNGCFGWASIFVIPLMIILSFRLMRLREMKIKRTVISLIFFMLWGSLLFAFVFSEGFSSTFMSPGGDHGEWLCGLLDEFVGPVGVILALLLSLFFYFLYMKKNTIPWLREKLAFGAGLGQSSADEPGREEDESDEEDEDDEPEDKEEDEDEDEFGEDDEDDEDDEAEAGEGGVEVVIDENAANGTGAADDDDDVARALDRMSGNIAQTIDTGDGEISLNVEKAAGDNDTGGDMLRPINPKDELSFYKPPTLDLLDKYEQGVHSIDKDEQSENANKIIRVLKDFNIEISSIKASVGPTITLYEVTPAPGVRISKIRNLEDDIAMSLSALCIRIVAPIPGKGTIGIEVPNAHKQIVPMASLLNSRKYKETDMALPLAIGKTISNEVYMVDMAKMPHLLVAGATGMGKSVGLNTIITSLLYKMHPAYLKFVMVDPKMVELSLYGVLEKHFLAKLEGDDEPIITDVNKVVRTLKSLCVEMDNRYKLLQMASVRSVKEYNEKFLNKELLPTKGHRFMPYIVVIIDEYGDLMMTAGREVEQPIARIAQKARAVGIHMIIATQRPTTNIITGTIKANFPARMAFRVISAIDSRTILDRSGANQLQGRGDMLFLAGNDPVRVQCALVETKEVERVCAHIAKQQGYLSAYILPDPDEAAEGGGGESGGVRGDLTLDKLDPLFAEAARVVVLAQHGSTSLIQRKLEVGFNRAGRIMDQLCKTGIVGEQEGSKPRQVLCADEADLEFRLRSLM